MSDIAIRVENLSKLYHIGAAQKRHDTLRDQLSAFSGQFADWGKRVFTRPSPLSPDPSDDTIWALRDVSFEVKRGEVVGIIGRNGAGKSTLLKILSRITEPTSGRAIIDGRVGSLLEVGTGFHPELTGRENIYLNGAILGMKKVEIERRFDEIVAFSEIEKFLDTPVKRYSSGMYVRLAFAVAAHLEPEILLVDEVLAVGDAAFQKKCLGKMGDVAKEGRTVLFVSHNMAAISAICSNGLLLDQGCIAHSGAIGESVRLYLNAVRAKESYRVKGDKLIWRGLANRDSLDNLRPDDDLNFVFAFEVGNEDIQNLHIDCALLTDQNERAIHIKSKFVMTGFDIHRKRHFDVKYSVISPKLAPGLYHLTLYAYSGNEVLLWIEDIDACHVVNKSFFGIVESFDRLTAPIIPEFRVEMVSR